MTDILPRTIIPKVNNDLPDLPNIIIPNLDNSNEVAIPGAKRENINSDSLLKLLESVTKSKTPLQTMDTIKKMQNLIYDKSSPLRVSKDMKNLVTRSI